MEEEMNRNTFLVFCWHGLGVLEPGTFVSIELWNAGINVKSLFDMAKVWFECSIWRYFVRVNIFLYPLKSEKWEFVASHCFIWKTWMRCVVILFAWGKGLFVEFSPNECSIWLYRICVVCWDFRVITIVYLLQERIRESNKNDLREVTKYIIV